MPEPTRIRIDGLRDYLEALSKAVFQPGMSWKVVDAKWPGIKEAFHDFDVESVADMGESDLDELTNDTRVIRNRRKLEAVVHNARRMIELDREFGGFQKYLRSHDDFPAVVKDLRKNFKFLGDTGCYFFMHVVGEEVPPHEEWMASRRK
ncbi:MAG: DNA-3-methyladenine glycosylase I [Chloroflexi bacterium]|nr:DNA-3-methyladenine glycosylase I [Chloroflexota bacterium]